MIKKLSNFVWIQYNRILWRVCHRSRSSKQPTRPTHWEKVLDLHGHQTTFIAVIVKYHPSTGKLILGPTDWGKRV